MAVTFALSAMVLLALAGGGIDYARLATRRTQLQNAADAGVLAAGNYLKLAVSTPAAASSIVEDTLRAQAPPRPGSPYNVHVTVADDKTNVAATVDETVKLSFGGFIGVPTARVAVRSKANIVGRMRLCLLTLDPLASGAFLLEKNPRSPPSPARSTAIREARRAWSVRTTLMRGHRQSAPQAGSMVHGRISRHHPRRAARLSRIP